MKISKTQFKNFMRCDRFAALNEIYHEKDKAIVSITDDLELEDLMSYENEQFKKVIIDSMFSEDGSERDEVDPSDEMLAPYYSQLEMIAGNIIKKKFPGNVIFDLDTFNQKRFSYLKDGFSFYCFLDGYQEDENTIRIFEVKATTSNKFSPDKLFYRDNGEKKSFFVELPSGIVVPREDIEEVSVEYVGPKLKLFDRFHECGKYIYDLAYQSYVFQNTYKTNKKVEYYLVTLNHEYIHDGKTDENNNPIYGDDIIKFFNLTSLTNQMQEQLEDDTTLVINRLNRMYAEKVPLGKFCERNKTTQCPFYDICHDDFPEKNSVFIYKHRHHGFKNESGRKFEFYELINKGARHALDIPEELMNRPINKIQRRVIENKKPYYNYRKIFLGINSLKYPIYHLDFESFNAPLPRFKGESPYTQSLFQFSIHIEHAPGVCDKDKDHYGYLAKTHDDIRRELVEEMLKVIKKDGGSVLVYNMSFEKTRLKELQEYFPEYKDDLQDIIDRLFDLQHIVENNTKLYERLGLDKEIASQINFYHEDLNGSYSIKKVLPIFTSLTYQGMRVGNGTDAMVAYNKLKVLTGKEYEETYEDLVNYCKQDTWAMFEILNELRKL